MVGLHYLKHTYNLSDEGVVSQWLENPYWQYFCGNEYFEHDFPIDASSMTRWRKRVSESGKFSYRCKALSSYEGEAGGIV